MLFICLQVLSGFSLCYSSEINISNIPYIQNRIIFDEEPFFFKYGIDNTLKIISEAGFNVYVPCIWHGVGALYNSSEIKKEPKFEKYFEYGHDHFRDLILKAHAKGIQVHPWFYLAKGDKSIFPSFAKEGTPIGAFDLYNPAFRDFIIREISAFVTKYDIDGIVLDYVRTMGISFTKEAKKKYLNDCQIRFDEISNIESMSAETQNKFLICQQVTLNDIIRSISAKIKTIKPNVIISVCGHPHPKPQLDKEGRNEWYWLEMGWIDLVLIMDYTEKPAFSYFQKVKSTSLKPNNFALIVGNYDKFDGSILSRNEDKLIELIYEAANKINKDAVGIYYFGALTKRQIDKLRESIFYNTQRASWNFLN